MEGKTISEICCWSNTLCLIPSTLSFSIGTTELGGRPFSSCITVLAYFMTWLLRVSGLSSSKGVWKSKPRYVVRWDVRCFIRYNQREVTYQNEKGVFHLISKHQGDIHHTRVGVVFVWYPNQPWSNISNTRRSVASDIQTPRSNISNTRRSVSSDIHTPGELMHISYLKPLIINHIPVRKWIPQRLF